MCCGIAAMPKESRSRSQGKINSEIIIAAITLTVLLFFNSLSSPLSLTLKEVDAQLGDTGSPKDKTGGVGKDPQVMAKKFKEAKGEKIPNHYVVVLKNSNFLSSSVRSSAIKAINQGATIRHIYEHALNGFAIQVPNDNVLAAVLKIPEVDYVEPDVMVRSFAQILPTGVDRVDGDLSSTKSGDGSGIVNVDVGIMDTGVDLNHPDLNVYRQVTFVSGTTSGNDDNGHGTAVAGIAAAKDDSQGVVGISPGARLWSIKVLNSNGIGSTSDIIKGIDYVTQHANEIDVVNLSFGGDGSSDALHSAIIKSVAAGVTYAAAGGNDAKDASSVIPASYPEVIAVSAIVDTDGKCGGISTTQTSAGKDDSLASFSNFGPVIDMAAPGVLIKTTARASSYANGFSGTSASTPHVTGAAALYKSENPGASPSAVRNALRNLGSLPTTICDGKGHGYFTGDHDNNAEPLLYTGIQSTTNTCTTNLPISGVTASGNDGNVPSNVLDNNLGTRWSSLGVGQFITADLASVKNICSVDIAWYRGNERQYHFVISTSTDGSTFTQRFSGDSSGTTLNSEKYAIPPVDARFVRITVNGNTANTWASITELDVFGSSSSALSATYNYGPSLTLSGPTS